MSFPKILGIFLAACSMLVAWSPVSADPVALQYANNVWGNQAYSGVGVSFTVNEPVPVFGLGIFDSGQNGIAASAESPLSAYLFNITGDVWEASSWIVVASQVFYSGNAGTLDGASRYRFKPVDPVTLATGTYVLVGYGWNGDDLEHNCVSGGACETFNTGGGLFTYLGSPWAGGALPAGTPLLWLAEGSPNYFSSANLQFEGPYTPVPEPASLLLLGSGLISLGARRRKRARL